MTSIRSVDIESARTGIDVNVEIKEPDAGGVMGGVPVGIDGIVEIPNQDFLDSTSKEFSATARGSQFVTVSVGFTVESTLSSSRTVDVTAKVNGEEDVVTESLTIQPQEGTEDDGGDSNVFDVAGNFETRPPDSISGQFEFGVAVQNNGDGQNFDIDAVLTKGSESVIISRLTARYIAPGNTKIYDYIVTENEVSASDGDYTLEVLVEPTFGEKAKRSVVSQPVTVNLKNDPKDGTNNGDNGKNGENDKGESGSKIAILGGLAAAGVGAVIIGQKL